MKSYDIFLSCLTYFTYCDDFKGFTGGADGKESACNEGTQVEFLGREDPLEKEIATHSGFLPGKFHGLLSLIGYSPWGRKESETTE